MRIRRIGRFRLVADNRPAEIRAVVADVGPSRVDERVVARLAELNGRVRVANERVLESSNGQLSWAGR